MFRVIGLVFRITVGDTRVGLELRASHGADVRGQMSYFHTGMDVLLCDVQFYRLVAIFRLSARAIGYTSSGFDVRRLP